MQGIEFIDIEGFSSLISKCQIKVCWVAETPNRNSSVITKQVAEEMAPSLRGCPIVAHWNEEKQDFEEHNKLIQYEDGKFIIAPDTVPFGFVDINAKLWFQFFTDPDGVMREYLCTEGWLWTEQFPECKRIIEKGNNQSMELDTKLTKGNWAKDVNGKNRFFIINEAIISKLCVLGEDVEPCFEGANITAPKIEFSLGDDFKTKLYSMMTEIKNILSEGGTTVEEVKTTVEEEVTPTVEEAPVEETPAEEEVVSIEETTPEVEETPAEETPATEEVPVETEEVKPAQYNLDEIPEYIELKNEYAALKEEVKALKEFKASIDKKEKEDMINSFYMLSDEDKQDVRDNIDTYSLNDIEAKLSILCVRNKVNFNLNEEAPITYSLENANSDCGENLPDWIKAVKSVAKEN